MAKSQYDAVITNIADTSFTAYYKKGICMKLSDGITVINIWKPGKCPHYYGDGEVFTDAMIEVSGNSTNRFTYSDFQKLQTAIERGIDYLNLENENLIDRKKIGTYNHSKITQPEKQKIEALKYADLEIGGIYIDEKKKQWLFLGKGTLFENGSQQNRSNDGVTYSEFMYMEYSDETKLEETGTNEFTGQFFPHPDTYATKKRFFEKLGQLNITQGMPITIKAGTTEYQVCDGMKPKSYKEMYESKGRGL